MSAAPVSMEYVLRASLNSPRSAFTLCSAELCHGLDFAGLLVDGNECPELVDVVSLSCRATPWEIASPVTRGPPAGEADEMRSPFWCSPEVTAGKNPVSFCGSGVSQYLQGIVAEAADETGG